MSYHVYPNGVRVVLDMEECRHLCDERMCGNPECRYYGEMPPDAYCYRGNRCRYFKEEKAGGLMLEEYRRMEEAGKDMGSVQESVRNENTLPKGYCLGCRFRQAHSPEYKSEHPKCAATFCFVINADIPDWLDTKKCRNSGCPFYKAGHGRKMEMEKNKRQPCAAENAAQGRK